MRLHTGFLGGSRKNGAHGECSPRKDLKLRLATSGAPKCGKSTINKLLSIKNIKLQNVWGGGGGDPSPPSVYIHTTAVMSAEDV